jgi:phospholipid/cholesterol/gamma-HCH transport system substrate-binding protein
MDLTIPRLKRSLFLGTRWGDPNAPLTPAPGDPAHQNYTYEPLNVGITPPLPEGEPGAAPPSAPEAAAPLLPVTPPAESNPPPASSVFAGPYPPGAGGS